MVSHLRSNEIQQINIWSVERLMTAEHFALKLILSAHICKSATDQLIKALLKFLCHSDLSSRTEMKTVLQNKGQSWDMMAAVCWLSTQQNLLQTCTFSRQGKITLSILSWQNDRGSFNGFLRDHWSFSPSLISVLPAKGDIIGSTQHKLYSVGLTGPLRSRHSLF